MKNLDRFLQPEYIFLIIGIIFGSLFINVNPPFHSNDEDRHFLHAYHIYDHGFLPEISADSTELGGQVPTNLTNVIRSFQGVPYHLGKKIKRSDLEKRKNVPLMPNQQRFEKDHLHHVSPYPYLHNALAIAIGSKFNDNPVALGTYARYGSLIVFLISIFFILRIMPVFKLPTMAFALSPMVLYQCTSVNYDVMSYIFAFAFFGLFTYYSFDPKAKINLSSLIMLVIFAILAKIAKNGYFLLPLVILLVPKEKFDLKFNVKFAYAGLTLILLSLFLEPTFMFQWYYSSLKEGLPLKQIVFQNDFLKDSSIRRAELFTDPFGSISNLWGNLIHFKQNWTAGVLGKFGYSYSELPQGFYIVHGLALILIAFFDGNKNIQVQAKQKIGIGAIIFLTMAIVIVGFYTMSPIGAEMIFGFQGRYLIPVIPFLLFLLYNNKIVIPEWQKNKNLFVGLYIVIILAYTVNQMYDLFYDAF